MDGTLTILGCGGSAGVPTIGNFWGACDPAEPRNVRTRTSIALQTQTTLVIVDAGPDFKDQMNRENLGCPDAIIVTHDHSDHVTGLEELRILQRIHKRKFPLHASKETLESLQARMGYLFKDNENGFYPSVCTAQHVKDDILLEIGDVKIQTCVQRHGSITSMGLRVGQVGYSTDMKSLPKRSIEILQGIETWIVDGCGFHNPQNPVHASIEEIMEMNTLIGAKKIFLTHLPHTMDYNALVKELPDGYAPSYDGMKLLF